MVIQAGNTNVLEIPLLNLASPETFLNTVININGNPSKTDIMSQIRIVWYDAVKESKTQREDGTFPSKSAVFITALSDFLSKKIKENLKYKETLEYKVISAYLKYFK